MRYVSYFFIVLLCLLGGHSGEWWLGGESVRGRVDHQEPGYPPGCGMSSLSYRKVAEILLDLGKLRY
jgi:hypothetical protein